MNKFAGFTLFELMIAMAIVAILTTIGVPAYQGYLQKAALTDMLQLMSSYKTAVELCMLENGSSQPCDLGRFSIPKSKVSRYVSAVAVAKGQITLTGQSSLSGLTVVLKPQLTAESGEIHWQRSCSAADNAILEDACQSVFYFDDLSA